MQSAVAQATERFGGLDVVMANAGIATYGTVLNVDPAAFYRLIDINVNGVFNTVRAALPSIIERQGYVLVVSSLAAYAVAPSLAAYGTSKAGVENFANALRLEVSHLGVDVGSAHMSWIDTPMVRDAKSDLPAFQEMLRRMPPPLGKTTSIDKCGTAFAKGIEKRKRRVFCPGWVRWLRLGKPMLSTNGGEYAIRRSAAELVPELDAQVAALGRSVSARFTDADE
jgi:NAD(P)-dependent dehydrogenase (short-subunit alcohol dehydrogenase family)